MRGGKHVLAQFMYIFIVKPLNISTIWTSFVAPSSFHCWFLQQFVSLSMHGSIKMFVLGCFFVHRWHWVWVEEARTCRYSTMSSPPQRMRRNWWEICRTSKLKFIHWRMMPDMFMNISQLCVPAHFAFLWSYKTIMPTHNNYAHDTTVGVAAGPKIMDELWPLRAKSVVARGGGLALLKHEVGFSVNCWLAKSFLQV